MIRPLALRTATLALPFALTLAAAALAPHAQAQPQTQAQPTQSDPVAEMLRARGERYHRAPDSAQNPDEVRRTQALNAEIVAQNDLAESQDRANQAAYAEAQRRYQAEMEQTQAEARAENERHEADLRAADEAQARYEREMADWRATVAACERGDRARCNAGRQPPY
ncbi:cell wall hydrolase [Brevundimonas naejangsanensis]|uniref:Cell wall hydrolase n=1 Tax=Brevundimonas naejangsanensis TaxID=588932 RepID=A0A494RDB5_9CAUL|nr:cell wall hydrolase [Brevundimonas naejangsanensis]AYG94318.1 cell wall hydrolase [Brevundimonas naejangsanensis]